MEKVTFVDPQTKESIDFFVVEETQVNGTPVSYTHLTLPTTPYV